jgi:hypothetical protein
MDQTCTDLGVNHRPGGKNLADPWHGPGVGIWTGLRDCFGPPEPGLRLPYQLSSVAERAKEKSSRRCGS